MHKYVYARFYIKSDLKPAVFHSYSIPYKIALGTLKDHSVEQTTKFQNRDFRVPTYPRLYSFMSESKKETIENDSVYNREDNNKTQLQFHNRF